LEEQKEHSGFPVFLLEDGNCQLFYYYKYALVTQYLIEQKGLNFDQICASEISLDALYSEMLVWSKT